MGPVGTALKLRMELAPHVPRVLRQLHDLHQMPVRRRTGHAQARRFQLRPERVAALIPVAVPLPDLRRTVGFSGAGALRQHAGVLAQPHGAALVGDAHLIGHQVDDRMGGGFGKLGAVGVGPACGVAGELDDRDLHAQADAEVGYAVLPSVLCRQDHAFDAAVAEAARHQDTAAIPQHLADVLRRQGLGIHPFDVHVAVAGGAGVKQRLHHAEIGVVQLRVLAHQRDLHPLADTVDPVYHSLPVGHIRHAAAQSQLTAHHAAQPRLLQQQRRFVQCGRRDVGDDAVLLHVAEQGDLPPHVLGDGPIGAAHQHVRLDAHAEKFLDGVLGRLALQLSAARDGHDQRHVDIQHIIPALFRRHLPDSLQKRLALDVAHRAADLRDDHIGLSVVHGVDAALDLVGDVGDDLHRAPQIAALPLAVQHRPEHLAGGHGGVAVQRLVHKPLIVSQIQIRLGAVVGDEHLAVLIGAHGARSTLK